MKIKFMTLAAISTLTLGVSACMENQGVLSKAPGNYESTTSTTNSNGTNVSRDTQTDVTVDRYGNKNAVVETKTTTDPEGLFNKSTTTNTTKVSEDRY
jgi:hypothetical protein